MGLGQSPVEGNEDLSQGGAGRRDRVNPPLLDGRRIRYGFHVASKEAEDWSSLADTFSPSSSVTPTMTPLQIETRPRTQIQRYLQGSAPCRDNNSTCPACHYTKSCCMLENYNIFTPATANRLSCGSQSVQFVRVTGFTVFDSNSYACNCGGTGGGSPACTGAAGQVDCMGKPHGSIFGACRGNDDKVEVQFNVEINIKPEFNVGLYINTKGGDAVTGTDGCTIAGLTERDSSGNLYKNTAGATLVTNLDANQCLDFAATGTLLSYPFQRMKLQCVDSGGASKDGLLDFSVAASFAQAAGKGYYFLLRIQSENINKTCPNTPPHL
jgi:hypothetical protein